MKSGLGRSRHPRKRGQLRASAAAGALVVTALISGIAIPFAARAGEWDFSGSIAGELRVFPNSPAFDEQDDTKLSPSIAVEPEVVYEWNGGDDRITFVPFGRWDAHDDNRSHVDLRELNWLHVGDDWDSVIGVEKVFWGVTESRHLVDIINQDDAVEDVDGEDKLGQPMLNLNLFRDWGTVSGFVLPGFRERTFRSNDARLRGSLPVDDDNATYESNAEEHHIDFAVRWAQTFDDLDIGIAHFHGTSREPRLLPRVNPDGRVVLIPRYDQIDQTSLDAQLTKDAWLWKLEAITRSGQGDRFFASVAGFEYTLFGILDSNADLGLLAEYLYDGRDEDDAPPVLTDDDFFLGARATLNDEQDTTFLIGGIIDRDNQSTSVSIEAERRLGEFWKVELEGRLFVNVDDDDLILNGVRDDDVITLRLTRYF
ncbi:hypothetical protein [Pelagibius sp. Alg239-R121]|uniref:hypothetical protein n=1 Tax=Pelagibius sp. Alg239-R121 TaxID=2993448 RepID=UPI0024A7798B|nr:hypothetical protein [Pelagibius sp. Alg239-R121]